MLPSGNDAAHQLAEYFGDLLKKDSEGREKQLKNDLEKAQKDEEFQVELRKRLGLPIKSEKKEEFANEKDAKGEKLSCSQSNQLLEKDDNKFSTQAGSGQSDESSRDQNGN